MIAYSTPQSHLTNCMTEVSSLLPLSVSTLDDYLFDHMRIKGGGGNIVVVSNNNCVGWIERYIKLKKSRMAKHSVLCQTRIFISIVLYSSYSCYYYYN